jgi:hypothetical protein
MPGCAGPGRSLNSYVGCCSDKYCNDCISQESSLAEVKRGEVT